MCQKKRRNRFLFQLLSRVDISGKKADGCCRRGWKKMADKFTFEAIFDLSTTQHQDRILDIDGRIARFE